MDKIDKSRFGWVGPDPEHQEGISRPSITYWRDAMNRLVKNRVALVCLCIIVLLILGCAILPAVSPFSGREQHLTEGNASFFTPCTDTQIGRAHV